MTPRVWSGMVRGSSEAHECPLTLTPCLGLPGPRPGHPASSPIPELCPICPACVWKSVRHLSFPPQPRPSRPARGGHDTRLGCEVVPGGLGWPGCLPPPRSRPRGPPALTATQLPPACLLPPHGRALRETASNRPRSRPASCPPSADRRATRDRGRSLRTTGAHGPSLSLSLASTPQAGDGRGLPCYRNCPTAPASSRCPHGPFPGELQRARRWPGLRLLCSRLLAWPPHTYAPSSP